MCSRTRAKAMRLAYRFEAGQFFSQTARQIMMQYTGVSIEAYSYGDCFVPGAFPTGSMIGRYVSIAGGVRVFSRNHPMDRLSMHPFFYNRNLGFVSQDTIQSGHVRIDHDAWIGHNVILTPGCTRIGIGSVVGAGSVVTRDVPDFAVVAGNPAKLLRYRFDTGAQRAILRSEWWTKSIEEVASHMKWMTESLPSPVSQHPLLSHNDVTATTAEYRRA
ncbi:MAG: CatB-related O-acetyltransferase [Phycisphaeraceae bacterium]|nr:CatB-related O-acetyltransferase [Phycisphaerales bacterium]MCB9861004.1 CatB-related O-acetyltransferase [Phycisphaeraceae bacterium]